jgi:hypothetical protein
VFDVIVALTPWNLTKVAPVRSVPVIVTEVPTGPEAGVNEVIVGAATTVTVKSVALVAVPPAVVTVIGPVVAVAGTAVTIVVAVLDVITALVPRNLTEVAPVRFVPVIATEVPTGPELGVNDVMVGAAVAATAKLSALSAIPPVGVVT